MKKRRNFEYSLKSSPPLLFQHLSTVSGLSRWFADNVTLRNKLFIFEWDDGEEIAELLQNKNNELVRFRWKTEELDEKKYYFEFKILTDELTKDVSLVITDFCHDDELEETQLYWDNQIAELKQVLGSG